MKTKKKFNALSILVVLTGLLLLVPLIAMQFSDEVVWTPVDFIIAGVLLLATGLAYIFITRRAINIWYRIATATALGSLLFLIWTNMAVGIIGSENNPVNQAYFLIPVTGIVGGLLSRFRPSGMAMTAFAMAIIQALITLIALSMGVQHSSGNSILQIFAINLFFIVLFVFSGWLFRRAVTK